MKKIGIVTDSHSSISPEQASILGVHVLPMPFMIDGADYLEGVTLTREQFFAHQRAGAEISTSQPSPADVLALWDELLLEYETLLYMPISSGLSGSCQTAMGLAEDEPYQGRVFVVDNGRIATPLHRSILDAIELIDKGFTAAQCKEALEQARDELTIYIAVQTLEYLKKGGRISATTAAVGTLLNIKPILQLTTGKLESYKKARGMMKAKEIMLESIRSDLPSALPTRSPAATYTCWPPAAPPRRRPRSGSRRSRQPSPACLCFTMICPWACPAIPARVRWASA